MRWRLPGSVAVEVRLYLALPGVLLTVNLQTVTVTPTVPL